MENIYIFDMGRVILKSSNLKGMYKEANPKCDYQTFKDLFYNSKESIEVYSGLISDDAFFKIIEEKTESQKSAKDLKEIYFNNKGQVYENTLEIIKNLKNNNDMVCLLSNLKEVDYAYLSSVIDMKIFDEVFLSYLMGVAKPDKRIYEAVINKLGTNNFYFFDDTAINVEVARSLGINAFTVTGDTIDGCFEKILTKK